MNEQDLITVMCGALCIMFWGGVAVGMMYSTFAYEDRNSTARYPRPGTEPTRERFKPFRKHPDMLAPDETENP